MGYKTSAILISFCFSDEENNEEEPVVTVKKSGTKKSAQEIYSMLQETEGDEDLESDSEEDDGM